MTTVAGRRRALTPALIALAVAILVNAGLVYALAHLSRAVVALESESVLLAAPLKLVDPPTEAEQSLIAARAAESELIMPVPPPPIEAPESGDVPVPASFAPSTSMVSELPILAQAIPDFVSDAAGLAGPSSAADLPARLALGPGDAPPELLTPINLERFYPRPALRRAIAGVTRLQLEIGTDGTVRRCDILSSEPAGEFDDAARRLGMSLRFRPERRDGRAVPSVMVHSIQWQPQSQQQQNR